MQSIDLCALIALENLTYTPHTHNLEPIDHKCHTGNHRLKMQPESAATLLHFHEEK
jgi:hypothetical protein